ncbi:MAG TPA: ABC transporter ATP-binding protein [Phycisphaerae bacterium]|nr:ABC transporter ATP-binding protein [Phycisphaerae bacterium]HNU45826.1 ABC transporter ATP-binding protein [Phycisphaerae bacterium]
MSSPAVQFVHVSKRFRLGETHDSLGDLLAAGVRRLRGRRGSTEDASTLWAVRDVSFAAEAGEALGIIGPNGAGKSTVLRLLAGILRADEGEVRTHGRLSALIEVGAGFHGDLTGRENIFLNGAILGMRRAEIRGKLDAVVAFAGLERFLDTPVKRYSSGMYARLGFSIAAHVDPEVLLVDEVLSVGDAAFRLRCVERMRELVQTGTTLVFVTHNLDQMQSICRRAVVLEAGRVSFAGEARVAVGTYLKAMSRAFALRPTDLPVNARGGGSGVEFVNLRLLNADDDEVAFLRSGESLRARVRLHAHRPIRRLVLELNLRATPEENLLSFNSGRDARFFEVVPGLHEFTLTIAGIPLSGGQYFWNLRVWDADGGTTELDTPACAPMVIDDQGRATGALTLDHQWERTSPSHAAPHGAETAAAALVAPDGG